jgi:hypothetical protein
MHTDDVSRLIYNKLARGRQQPDGGSLVHLTGRPVGKHYVMWPTVHAERSFGACHVRALHTYSCLCLTCISIIPVRVHVRSWSGPKPRPFDRAIYEHASNKSYSSRVYPTWPLIYLISVRTSSIMASLMRIRIWIIRWDDAVDACMPIDAPCVLCTQF